MAIEPNTFEFNLLFALILIVIATKFTLSAYLLKKILDKKKSAGAFKLDFIFGVFILMICLGVSRSIYFYYDFLMTQFDPDKLWREPNVTVWKIAGFISALGVVFLLFVLDKSALHFKFKGLLAIVVFAISLVQLLYPIHNSADFKFVSSLGLLGIVAGIIIPVVFLYIGIKTPGLRKVCFLIVLGIVVYSLGSFLVSENVLAPLRKSFGSQIEVTAFLIFALAKIFGLTTLAYTVTKLKI